MDINFQKLYRKTYQTIEWSDVFNISNNTKTINSINLMIETDPLWGGCESTYNG